MPKEKYTKTNIHKILLAIIFILVIGFGFGKGEKAEAADPLGTCRFNNNTTEKTDISKDDCLEACKVQRATNPKDVCLWKENSSSTWVPLTSPVQDILPFSTYENSKEPEDSCSGWDNVHIIDCSLLALLKLFVNITTLASTLFGWIMKPENISSILSSKAIYEGWALVRDALNVSFIMFLLFSAFATVFQIDKYSYKNILRTLVIMALLVNFSFPISRFIIDVSNMLMYYFVTTLNIGSDKIDILINFASVSNLPAIMHPAVGNDTTSLLAAVIFVFIFMVTMLTISILFVVRTLALAVLIIFSSLAFVGTAVPPLAKHSSDWWKKLFDYSFFGPIMLFMMYIASSLMNEIQKNGTLTMTAVANKNSSVADYIASLAFFSLPIIILWIGLGIAKEMSGSAGSAIVGKAQGFMKGAGKWTVNAPFRYTGISGGAKQRWEHFKRSGLLGSDRIAEREAKIGGMFGGDKVAYKELMSKRVAETAKKHDTANASIGDLQLLAKSNDKFEKAAAIQALADKGVATGAQLQDVGKSFGETSQVFHQLATKIKAYDPVAAFSDATGKLKMDKLTEHINSNQFDAKKINSNSLGNADFLETAFKEDAISHESLEELRKKSPAHRNAISASLGTIAGDTNYGNLDTLQARSTNATLTQDQRDQAANQLRIARNIQTAHLAQTGKLHASMGGAGAVGSRAVIFKGLNANTAKRMNHATVSAHEDELVGNINSGRYRAIIQGMDEDPAAQARLNEHARVATNTFAAGSAEYRTFERNKHKATFDPELMHI